MPSKVQVALRTPNSQDQQKAFHMTDNNQNSKHTIHKHAEQKKEIKNFKGKRSSII